MRCRCAKIRSAQVLRARAGRPSRRGRSARRTRPRRRAPRPGTRRRRGRASPRSPGTMPSSIACLASGAGASDAAVAETAARRTSARRARGRGAAASSSPRSLRPRPPCRAGAGAVVATRRSASAAHRPATSRLDRLARQEDLVGQALLDDLAVQRATARAARRGCRGDDPAVLEHDDLVGERDRREPVGDDERRAAGHHLAQRGLDLLLGRRVDADDVASSRIEDPRVGEQRARDREPLALAAARASARARRRACRSRRAALR